MKNEKILKKLGLTFTCIISSSIVFASPLTVRDSIGVENQGGKKVILHKLESRESYYSLGRKYGLSPKDIISFNSNKSLKAGDILKIPTGITLNTSTNNNKATPTTEPSNTPPKNGGASITSQASEFIEYKVGTKETLFAISKRFGVGLDAIKEANSLTDNSLKAGQIIKIPNTTVEAAASDPSVEKKVISNQELNAANGQQTSTNSRLEDTPVENVEESKTDSTPANRYGIKQVASNGIGIWMDDLNGETGKMLALHNSAPVGTVIKITNPMTNRTTYAKVVGKFNETSENKDAIIVISKSVASLIGVIDRRFQVNLSY